MIKAYAIHYVLNAKLSFIYKTNKDAKMSWISVCQQDDITEDEPKAIEVEGKKIGVFLSMTIILRSRMFAHMPLRC